MIGFVYELIPTNPLGRQRRTIKIQLVRARPPTSPSAFAFTDYLRHSGCMKDSHGCLPVIRSQHRRASGEPWVNSKLESAIRRPAHGGHQTTMATRGQDRFAHTVRHGQSSMVRTRSSAGGVQARDEA